jgi:glycosyltransferase involved in cell wall biosynthesis
MIDLASLEKVARSDKTMRILYFAPHQIWPLNTGARLRNYQLARRLADRCSVTLVEMRHAGEEPSVPPDDSGLASVVTLNKGHTYTPSKILRGLVGPTPVTVLNCWSPRLASELADVLRYRQFDTVQIEGVHLMEYMPVIRDAPGCPVVIVDWHNIESEMMWRYAETTGSLAKRIAARRTARLIERAEVRLLEMCPTHTVTSKRERHKLLGRHPGAHIQVIPNGVDAGYYSPEAVAEACRRTGLGEKKQTILFVGSMDYHANVDAVTWFSRTAWPEIARNHPDIHFTIVGRDPAPAIRALASDRVHVTGTVDDVRPFYAFAVAAVVPIRSGGGTRLKILESMAAGVPVVSTRLGAEGIEAEDDVHLFLADNGQQIAAAIARIISSPQTRSRLSHAGRALVSKIYDWSVIGTSLYGIHEALVESRTRRDVRKVF